MRVWRCTKVRYAATAFLGEGSQDHGGRWHRAGTRIVYASESPALAVLETVVHYGELLVVRDQCVLVSLEVPDGGLLSMGQGLPSGWDRFPHLDETQEVGSAWAAKGETLAVLVPSAIVRGLNILINPVHPGFAAAAQSVAGPERIPFGGRV